MTTRANDRWLLPFLAVLRGRPAMWTGDYRVESLETYMAGYEQARWDCGFVGLDPEDKMVLRGFKAWLAARVGEDPESKGWVYFVMKVDPSERTVQTFFRLLEEYLRSTGLSLDDVEPWHFQGTYAMSHD